MTGSAPQPLRLVLDTNVVVAANQEGQVSNRRLPELRDYAPAKSPTVFS